MTRRLRVLLVGALFAAATASAADFGSTGRGQQQPGETGGETPIASAARGSAPAISTLLDADGRLALPEGFSGSIDPSGFRIVSGEGEPLRFAPGAAKAGQVDDRWAGTGVVGNGCNGQIRAVAVDAGGQVFAGGFFTQCGTVVANNVARFNTTTQTWSSLGSGAANGVSSNVFALAIAGSDVYVGGDFTQAGGATANRVARFNTTTQTWSSLGSGTANGVSGCGSPASTGCVRALAIVGSDVFVGGVFTQAGGATARSVARFNTTTQTWSSLGSGAANGVSSSVFALAIAGSDVYVGGFFTQAGGATANSVARFNTTTQSWSPLGTGAANGVNSQVNALAIAGSDVYVGGVFTQAGGTAANRVARFNTTTQTWSSLGSGAANGVNFILRAFAIAGSDVYVGGSFIQAGGAPASFVARFNTTTQTWSSLGSGAANGVNNLVFALAIAGSDVYMGGYFTQAGGATANFVARLNSTTQTWSTLGSGAANGVGGVVSALAIAGSDIYLGGFFAQAGGATASFVARFNTTTQIWSSLGSGAANGVSGCLSPVSTRCVLALAIAGSDVYAVGDFSQAGGATANRVARFNTSTQIWSSLGSGAANGVDDLVSALAVAGNDVYVGGLFNQAGGAPANRVARFNTTTQTWSSLGSGTANGVDCTSFPCVNALAIAGSDVYVGGGFTLAGGATANNVARFNTTTQIWSSLGSGAANGVNGTVLALAIAGSDVVVGGSYTQAGGAAANRVARFNTGTQTWSSLGSGAANGVDSTVSAFAIAGSDVVVGGAFTQAGGAPANRVARFSLTQQRWFPLGSAVPGGEVFALAPTPDGLAIGGGFGEAGGKVTSNVALYRTGAPATVTVAATPLPTVVNQPVTVSATVTGSLGPAAGQIRLSADTGEGCTVNAPSGTCQFTFTTIGSRTINALYLGDADYEATASPGIEVRVGLPGEAFGNVEPLAAANGNAGDQGGTAVAVGGRFVVIGAPNGGGSGGAGAGEVIVFARGAAAGAGKQGANTTEATGALLAKTTDLQQVARLRPPAGGQIGDKWGAEVSISPDGSRIAIGAPGDEGGEGRVFLFDIPGTLWDDSSTPSRTLAPPIEAGVIPQGFGTAIDINDSGTVVASAPDADRAGNVDTGAVYAYAPGSSTGSALPAPPTNAPGDKWGSGVALDDAGRVATGTPGRDVGGRADQGAIDIYLINLGTPVYDSTLTPAAGSAGDGCGASVDRAGAVIAAGCPGMGTGAGGGIVWQQAGAGAVQETARLIVGADAAASGAGQSIALDGGLILLGAPNYRDPTAQANTGAAFAYGLPDAGWFGNLAPESTLAPADGAANDRYGTSVALAGGTAAVGIPNRDVIRAGASVEQQGKADAYAVVRVFRNGFE